MPGRRAASDQRGLIQIAAAQFQLQVEDQVTQSLQSTGRRFCASFDSDSSLHRVAGPLSERVRAGRVEVDMMHTSVLLTVTSVLTVHLPPGGHVKIENASGSPW